MSFIAKMVATITAYCSCVICTGPHSPAAGGHGLTASGTKPIANVTAAADWDVIGKGSYVNIRGIGVRVISDKGGGVKGNHIDLYFDSHEAAINFGRQKREVLYIKNPPNEFSFDIYRKFFVGEAFNVGQKFVPVGKVTGASSR